MAQNETLRLSLGAAVAMTVVLILLPSLRNLHISPHETFARPFFSGEKQDSISQLISDPAAAGIFAAFSVPVLWNASTLPRTLGVQYDTTLKALFGIFVVGFLSMLTFPAFYNIKMHKISVNLWMTGILLFAIVTIVRSKRYTLLGLPLLTLIIAYGFTTYMRRRYYIGEISQFLPLVWLPVFAHVMLMREKTK